MSAAGLIALLAEHDDPTGWVCDDADRPVFECLCGDRMPALDHDYITPADVEAAVQWHRTHVAQVLLAELSETDLLDRKEQFILDRLAKVREEAKAEERARIVALVCTCTTGWMSHNDGHHHADCPAAHIARQAGDPS